MIIGEKNEFESSMIELVKKECDEHRFDQDLDLGECDYRSFYVVNEKSIKDDNSQILHEKFGRVDFVEGEYINDALDELTMKTLIEEHPDSERINKLLSQLGGAETNSEFLEIFNTHEYISLRYTDPEGNSHLGFELYINDKEKNQIISWEMTENGDGSGFHLSPDSTNDGLTSLLKNIDHLAWRKQQRIDFLRDEENEKTNSNSTKRKPKI